MTQQTAGSSSADSALRERLRLFLLGRVLVVSVFLATIGGLWFAKPSVARPLLGETTFLVVILAYAGTVLSAFWVRWIAAPKVLAYGQILFDVLLLTGVLGVLGGGNGPLAVLYILPIANAAGLLMLPGALTAALVASAAYGALLFHERHLTLAMGRVPDAIESGPLVVAAVAFAVVGLLVGYLARLLSRAEGAIEEHRAEVLRLEEMQRAVADGVECGILFTDGSGKVRSANPASQRILALPVSSIVGREPSWLFPLLASAEEAAGDREHVEFDQRVGETEARRLRLARSPLQDTWGNSIGELLLVQDLTHIEELEAIRGGEEKGVSLILEDASAAEPPMSSQQFEDGLIGNCPQMAAISRVIDKVASTDATVLVTGESGTGKELVARAVHRRSPRSEGPFVVVNCGAIPENLVESELFGHLRGSFSGAESDRPGLFRRAHGGTIFLDEIGELSGALQVRLLRVLQDHRVVPVGGSEAQEVDVRVVAATNQILEELVKEGKYREDLYYRLAVVSIDLPPLRERGKDLGLLIEHFLRQGALRHDKPVRGVSAAAMRLLLRHPYPGNVRELENILEHAITLSDRETLESSDLPEALRTVAPRRKVRPHAADSTVLALDGALPEVPEPFCEPWEEQAVAEQHEMPERDPAALCLPTDPSGRGSLDEQLARQEKDLLVAALHRSAGVKKKAAALLGINYRSLRHRLQKYGLDVHGETAFRHRDADAMPGEVQN